MIYKDTVTVENGTIRGRNGSPLTPLGDNNIVDGEGVWTDGKFIFGSQTAGEEALPIPPPQGVLPLPFTYKYGENYYGGPTMEAVFDVGKTKTEIAGVEVDAFVSNGTHSYGARRARSYETIGEEDSEPFQWFDLNTGECLGTFSVADACVDKDGNLLTISSVASRFSGGDKNPDIKYDITVYYRSGKTHNPFIPGKPYSFDGSGVGLIQSMKFTVPSPYAYPVKRRNNDGSIKKDEYRPGYVVIRKNGSIMKKIPLDPYRDFGRSQVAGKMNQVQESGDGSGESIFANSSFVSRFYKRPSAYVTSASTTTISLHINEDASWWGFITTYANAAAYPWFSWTTSVFDPGTEDDYVCIEEIPIKEYKKGGLFQSMKNYWEHITIGNDMLYHWVYTGWPTTRKVKAYLHADISYSDMRLIGSKREKIIRQDLHMTLDAGTFFGEILDSPRTPSTFNVLKGTGITGVRGSWPDDYRTPPEEYDTAVSLLASWWAWWPRALYLDWVIVGTGEWSAFANVGLPQSAFAYFEESGDYKQNTRSPSPVSASKYESEMYENHKCKSGHTYYNRQDSLPTKFTLNDGYTIKLGTYPGSTSVSSFTIESPKGETVLEVNQGKNVMLGSNMSYNWWLIKVGRLKNGKWILCLGTDYRYYFVVDPKTGEGTTTYDSIHSTYSLKYVKNWNAIKGNIERLFKSQY